MSMTLEEAIIHAEKIAEVELDARSYALEWRDNEEAEKCQKCADEHRQLAEWLLELAERRKSDNEIPFGNASFDELDSIINAYEIHGNHKKVVELLKELSERRKLPEIIYCGECKHFQCNMRFDGSVPKGADAYECRHWCGGCDPMDYCSCGERAERRTDD